MTCGPDTVSGWCRHVISASDIKIKLNKEKIRGSKGKKRRSCLVWFSFLSHSHFLGVKAKQWYYWREAQPRGYMYYGAYKYIGLDHTTTVLRNPVLCSTIFRCPPMLRALLSTPYKTRWLQLLHRDRRSATTMNCRIEQPPKTRPRAITKYKVQSTIQIFYMYSRKLKRSHCSAESNSSEVQSTDTEYSFTEDPRVAGDISPRKSETYIIWN